MRNRAHLLAVSLTVMVLYSWTIWSLNIDAAAEGDIRARVLLGVGLLCGPPLGALAARCVRLLTTRRDDREKHRPVVARHEAAHAVVVAVMGGAIYEVNANKGSGGHCDWFMSSDHFTAAQLGWTALVSSVAGLVATPDDSVSLVGSRSDMAAAVDFASALVVAGHRPPGYPDLPLTLDSLIAAAREHASTLLTEHAEKVEHLAELLVVLRRIDGKRVHEALGIERPVWKDTGAAHVVTRLSAGGR